MKYLLISKKTAEQTLCDKVTIDGFDYYVSDVHAVSGDFALYAGHITKKLVDTEWTTGDKKIIATNNPNLDIPQVVDEVERLAFEYTKVSQAHRRGFIDGYNKSQETHPFSAEDIVEFAVWLNDTDEIVKQTKHLDFAKSDKEVAKELLQLWKFQQPKKIYYEK